MRQWILLWCGLLVGTVQAGDGVRLDPGPREVNLRELFKARARGD